MYSTLQTIFLILLVIILLYLISSHEYFNFKCPFGKNCRRLNCPFGCNKRCPNYICDRFGCGCRFNYTKYLV
jgi:hypothetical protein